MKPDCPPDVAPEPKVPWKRALFWAMYDFANTGYAMIVLALVFPRFYQSYFALGLSPAQQTFYYGLTVTLASLTVALLAPLLGSIGELAGNRKRLLLRFAVLGMGACVALIFVDAGWWWLASLIHILGMVCFYSGNLFFDSMLDIVSTRKSRNLISGMGYSFGYIAGFLLILIIYLVTNNPEALGLADGTQAVKALFGIAAVWWALFAIPLALGIREQPKPDRPPLRQMLASGLKSTWSTFQEVLRIKPVRYFLIAYLFYIDGLNTITTSAANLASTLGFPFEQIYLAFAIVQLAAVPCSILFGVAATRFGARTMLFIAMVIYLGVTLYGATIDPEPLVIGGLAISEMYVLAFLIGCVIGGVQALSRAFFANLIPEGRSVAFFGFYSMIGKSAAILGPAIMGVTALLLDTPNNPTLSTRFGFAAIGLLFILGSCFLWQVKVQRPSQSS